MNDATSSNATEMRTVRAGHYIRVALLPIFGVMTAQALTRMGIPVLYPFIQQEFGLSRAQIGLVTTTYATGILVTVVLAGLLTDYLGVKRIITVALLSLAAFTMAFPLADSLPAILVLVLVVAIVSSPLYPATTRGIIDWFPGRYRALAMGFIQAGIPLGGAVTAVLIPALTAVLGWRMAAAITGLLVLVIAIGFILLFRDAPRSATARRKFNSTAFKTILRNRSLVITICWGAIFIGFQFIVLSYFMLFLIEELRLSAILAGGMLAIAQVVSSVSRILWGAASDFVFHGRRIAVLVVIGFMTTSWMLGASLINVEAPRFTMYLIAIAIGISTISFQGIFTTLIGEQAEPGQIGVTAGLASMTNQISVMLMPPLFGHLVDISGSYSLSWRLAALAALVCTLILLTFGRERKNTLPTPAQGHP